MLQETGTPYKEAQGFHSWEGGEKSVCLLWGGAEGCLVWCEAPYAMTLGASGLGHFWWTLTDLLPTLLIL